MHNFLQYVLQKNVYRSFDVSFIFSILILHNLIPTLFPSDMSPSSPREKIKHRRAKDLKQKIQERLELDPEKQAMKLVVET